MKSILFTTVLGLLALTFACNVNPDGKDDKGYFIYVDSCLGAHTETNVSVSPVGVPMGGDLYLVTSDVCDSSVLVKRYILTK
ncbi:hypothetical protein [Sphingobacterium sp. UBA2074]|uniref:hypothetical protein n=1 Tax=Sphingobacterium sp. UBA2074 TaxID=1947487 RepID=UPI002579A999|nr:hypothetical protein [Sphingobacterium sp. UBA2074]